MVDWSQFFRSDSMVRLDFSRISKVGIGTVFGSLFAGSVSVILGFADIPIAILSAFTDLYAAVIDTQLGVPIAILRGAFAGATAYVQGSGAAGFFVALAIVLTTLYTFSVVVSRVR